VQKPPSFFSRIKPDVLLAVFSAAAYIPLLFLPFVFDDVMSVRNNPLLRDLSNAAYLFHPAYTHVFRNEGFEPFTFLYLMLAGKLVAWQAWGFHALSLLAHAACAWTVYKLALLLLGKEKPALLAGLLFALHPAQAESLVAALFSGTIFSALFFLAALYRFMERDGRDGAAGKLLTGLLFGVSLLFKERSFSGLPLFFLLPFLRGVPKPPGCRKGMKIPYEESPLTPASPGGGFKELRRRLPELLALSFFWTAALFSRLSAGRGSSLGFKDMDPAYLFAKLAAYARMLFFPFQLSPVYQKTPALPGPAGLAALRVRAVARHLPGVALVGEVQVEDLAQLLLQARVLDRRQHLDAALEVALHAVRRADVVLGRAGVAEVVDARVLQKPADDADHADVLGDARQAGTKLAGVAHLRGGRRAGLSQRAFALHGFT